MKLPFCLCAIALLATGGFAQVVTIPGQTKKNEPPPEVDATTARAIIDNAKNLGKAGNIVAVEQAVSALNRAKANTAGWYIETAQRLLLTAEQLARDGQSANVGALARRALQNLTTAEALAAKTPQVQAAAKSLEALVHERYLADRASALASYQAAAALAPENSIARAKAEEAATRLKNTDDDVKNKIAKGIR